MMRVGMLICLLIGAVQSLAGVVAVFMGLDGSVLLTTGSALMGSSGWAKAVQRKWEGNDATHST